MRLGKERATGFVSDEEKAAATGQPGSQPPEPVAVRQTVAAPQQAPAREPVSAG